MSGSSLTAIATAVLMVPDTHRVFDQDSTAASSVYRLPEETQTGLLDLGFPHRRRDGRLWFDELDLANASLALRLPAPRYLAMRRWPDVLRSVVAGEQVRYEVEVSARCEMRDPGHVCDLHLPSALAAKGLTLDPASASFTILRELDRTPELSVPEDLAMVFAEAEKFRFWLLPSALCADLSFLAATALANCELATRHLVARAQENGWVARRSYGLFLSSPYSLEHSWPEINLDDRWVSFDPHLINSLVHWGVLKPGQVPVTTALDSALFRIGEHLSPLIVDAGSASRVALITRRWVTGRPDGATNADAGDIAS